MYILFIWVYAVEPDVSPDFLDGPKVYSFGGLFGYDAIEILAEFFDKVSEVGSILSLSSNCGIGIILGAGLATSH